MEGVRAILWGLIFTPDSLATGRILFGGLMALAALLEGQGCFVTMLAASE